MSLSKLLRKELWANPALKTLYLLYTVCYIGIQTYVFVSALREGAASPGCIR